MKISICLPYAEPEYDRRTTLEWCRRADEGPFESLGCGERILSHTQDMRIVLAAAAAVTERIKIVPSLYVLPMHSAVRAAKELATLDVLSAGRVIATVGVGGREQDYRAIEAPFGRRLQRLDDGVATMKRIWSGDAPYEGADPVGPVPVQAGGPPLWTGAMMPKSIARSAHWADGLYGFTMNGDAAPARAQFDLARAAWESVGREKPYLATGFWCCLTGDADQRLKGYVYDYLKISGDEIARAIAETMYASSVDTISRILDGLEATGCDECFLVPATADVAEVDRLAEVAARR